MNDHLDDLAQRRAQLMLKAAVQREELGMHMHAIGVRAHTIDQWLLHARDYMRKPLVVVGGAAFAWFVGPLRALRLVGRAAFYLSAARRVWRMFR